MFCIWNTACINTCTQFTKCTYTHTHAHTCTIPLLAVIGIAAAVVVVEDTELVTGERGVA